MIILLQVFDQWSIIIDNRHTTAKSFLSFKLQKDPPDEQGVLTEKILIPQWDSNFHSALPWVSEVLFSSLFLDSLWQSPDMYFEIGPAMISALHVLIVRTEIYLRDRAIQLLNNRRLAYSEFAHWHKTAWNLECAQGLVVKLTGKGTNGGHITLHTKELSTDMVSFFCNFFSVSIYIFSLK